MAIDKKVGLPTSSTSSPSPSPNYAAAPTTNPSSSTSTSYSMGSGTSGGNGYQSIPTADPESQEGLVPPPAYSQSLAAHQGQGQGYAEARRGRKRSFRRAAHWTVGAVLVLLLWRMVASWGSRSTGNGGPYPPTSDGQPSDWAQWSDPTDVPRAHWPASHRGPYYSTTTNFSLDPAAASTLFVHAHGPGYGGRVSYVLGGGGGAKGGLVEVGVEAVYRRVGERDRITIAKMEDGDKGRQGVGIYSDDQRWTHTDSDVHIYVTVALPPTLAHSTNTLETDVENMSVQGASDLGTLSFRRIEVRSANGAVRFEGGLNASESVSLHSQNGRIAVDGALVTPVLEVENANGAVRLGDVVAAEVEGVSGNGRLEGSFAVSRRLKLRSDNGAVEAKVKVEKSSSASSGRGPDGRVEVDATASNGRVSLAYLAHASDVLLFSRVVSETGRASVRHAEAFVGEVEAVSEMGGVRVVPPPSSSSSGRKWEVVEDHRGFMKHEFHAKVYDKGAPSRLGLSTVRSEMGSVDVSFD